jgi:hypothetical protein
VRLHTVRPKLAASFSRNTAFAGWCTRSHPACDGGRDHEGSDMDAGRQAALDHIASLDEPRRARMGHLHQVLLDAIPDADVSMWQYAGPLIGYGSYEYVNSKGPAGRWFSVGLASRKTYVSLFSMALGDGDLVAAMHDRFPGSAIGKSCINIKDNDAVDDDAVRDLALETWAQFKDGLRRS